MNHYEKVRFVDGVRSRSVFLRVSKDGARFLVGTEVDKYGDDIEGSDFTERTRMIQKSVIVSRRPYVIDLKYGELVPKAKATKL